MFLNLFIFFFVHLQFWKWCVQTDDVPLNSGRCAKHDDDDDDFNDAESMSSAVTAYQNVA